MKIIFSLILFLSSLAVAQGTDLPGPVRITTPANPTTVFSITPATAQFACPTNATQTFWNLCAQNGSLTLDKGMGYLSLEGLKVGSQVRFNIVCPKGAGGINDFNGWFANGCTLTITGIKSPN